MQEAKRYAYLNARDAGATVLRARRLAGLGPHAPLRIRRMFAATGSYRDKPRSGRPLSYTPARLDQLEELLRQDPCKEHTAASLVALAIRKGILHTGANKKVAMRAWEKHLMKHGKRLTASSTSTRFLLTVDDAKERVKFAEAMLGLLGEEGARQCIFVDETVLEENPHPKSGLWHILMR